MNAQKNSHSISRSIVKRNYREKCKLRYCSACGYWNSSFIRSWFSLYMKSAVIGLGQQAFVLVSFVLLHAYEGATLHGVSNQQSTVAGLILKIKWHVPVTLATTCLQPPTPPLVRKIEVYQCSKTTTQHHIMSVVMIVQRTINTGWLV